MGPDERVRHGHRTGDDRRDDPAARATPALEGGPGSGDPRPRVERQVRAVRGSRCDGRRGLGKVGEETDRRIRAERLDETLQILVGLWTGEPFGFEGVHYRFGPMAFRPTPVQRPRIPIWVVGAWPSEASISRAARYDGLLPNVVGGGKLTPQTVAQLREWIGERRVLDGFEIVVEGTTDAADAVAAAAEAQQWADAGATWWVESDWSTLDPAAARRRIEAGPPRT